MCLLSSGKLSEKTTYVGLIELFFIAFLKETYLNTFANLISFKNNSLHLTVYSVPVCNV